MRPKSYKTLPNCYLCKYVGVEYCGNTRYCDHPSVDNGREHIAKNQIVVVNGVCDLFEKSDKKIIKFGWLSNEVMNG